ncbi:type III polyketide synthase [Paenibacillus naphthalenovorans]|uniref:type III polyketide synthase n=1 Tax=Paenibacillus naphthalenovorans TaxID=162209 RepID=UPI003D2C98F2
MEDISPIVSILGIGTAVPAFRMDQADVSQRLAEALREQPHSARWAKRIFRQCGVETRYTCEPNLLEPAPGCRYFSSASIEGVPTTAERMTTYKKESVPLGLEAARKALSDSGMTASGITHLITVSCTGQFLPGMDAALVQQLGLASTVNRLPLQFLGCAAGLKAINLSRQIVSGTPSAKVLIVCVELCTLHFQPSGDKEALFAASFFGDGASACIVGCAGAGHKGIFQLGGDYSVLMPESADEMVWEVGNYGFHLYLSPNIPRLIGRWLPAVSGHLAAGENRPELWAIHPGGRGIIDAVQDVYGLTDEQVDSSRDVLRRYGNLSSATMLFVLDDMRRRLQDRRSGPASGMAVAFGPGLTAEMARITYLPSVVGQEQLIGDAR